MVFRKKKVEKDYVGCMSSPWKAEVQLNDTPIVGSNQETEKDARECAEHYRDAMSKCEICSLVGAFFTWEVFYVNREVKIPHFV